MTRTALPNLTQLADLGRPSGIEITALPLASSRKNGFRYLLSHSATGPLCKSQRSYLELCCDGEPALPDHGPEQGPFFRGPRQKWSCLINGQARGGIDGDSSVQVPLLRCPRKPLQVPDLLNGPNKLSTGERRVAKSSAAIECCEFCDG
jgi:hypothetical protein